MHLARVMLKLGVAVVLALGGVAAADRTLTLDEALAQARIHNRDLHAARARVQAAQTGIEQARAAFLPTVTAQGKYTHNYKQVAIDFGAIVPGAGAIIIQKGEQLDANLNASVPLLAPAAYGAYRAAKLSARASEGTYAVTTASVMLAVAQAYYASAGADEIVTARTNAVAVAKETFDNAKARVAADVANQVEVTRAETALVRAEQAQAESENARATAYRGLATLVGTRDAIHVDPRPVPPAPLAPVEELVTQARTRRPELAVERDLIASAEATAMSDRWRWAPTLSAFGQVHVGNYAGFSGDRYAWAAGLSLDWLLYDGGARDAQRHLAEAQRTEGEAKLELLGDSVADEVANARGTLETKRKALVSAQRAGELARETLRLIRAQFDAGTTRQLDVLEAQDTLVGADVDVARARFELALADIELRRAAGAFP